MSPSPFCVVCGKLFDPDSPYRELQRDELCSNECAELHDELVVAEFDPATQAVS